MSITINRKLYGFAAMRGSLSICGLFCGHLAGAARLM